MNWRQCCNPFTFILTAFLLTTTSMAQADYEALLHQFDTYQPPTVLPSLMTAMPVSSVTPINPADSEFEDQVTSLRQKQKAWQQALTEPKADTVFYTPDSALLANLQTTAKNPDAAAKALTTAFTLETLEILVLLRSPAIQSKENQVKATLEGYSQVENLDTSLRQYAILTKSLMTGVGGMTKPDTIPLKFPFPGLLALKGEIVDQEAQAAREELEAMKRDTLTTARKVFAELLYARKAQETTQSLLQLLDSLQETVSARYQAGTTSFSDVTAIGSERERIKDELTTLVEEYGNSEALLRATLSLPSNVSIGAPVQRELKPTKIRLDVLYSLALERRQELRGQQAMIGRTERMLEMAETMIYPSFSQALSLFDNNEVSKIDGKDRMARTKESFPVTFSAANGTGSPKIPWFGLNDAYLRQTKQRLMALKKDLETTKATTILDVRLAWFRLDRAKRLRALYQEKLIPLTQANLDASQQRYAAGQDSFEKLVQSTSSWLTAKLTLARANSDLLATAAELDAAVGLTEPGIRRDR